MLFPVQIILPFPVETNREDRDSICRGLPDFDSHPRYEVAMGSLAALFEVSLGDERIK